MKPYPPHRSFAFTITFTMRQIAITGEDMGRFTIPKAHP